MIRRFNRYELKYLIDVSQREAIAAELVRQMRPDPHGDARGAYRVTSLYYDNAALSCYWSKREGIKFRRKVRIRTYGAAASGEEAEVLVEIKQRINRTVQKRRLRLPLGRAYDLCEGRPVEAPVDPPDRAVAAEVDLLARTLGLRPAVVISYRRQAWVGGDYEPGLRITFDEQLACGAPDRRLGPGGARWLFLPADRMIMEVKVNERVPLWVTRLLAHHHCRLRRVSKYCRGLAHLRGSIHPREHERGSEWTSY